MPLAPPRMLAAAGLVDTARVYGPSVYGAVPETDSMANQFAAMPSLHFGWALMVAVGLIAATRSRWRALWLLHPLLTLFVVVGTANHYWFDALAAAALLGLALLAVRAPGHRAAPPSVRRPLETAPSRSEPCDEPRRRHRARGAPLPRLRRRVRARRRRPVPARRRVPAAPDGHGRCARCSPAGSGGGRSA